MPRVEAIVVAPTIVTSSSGHREICSKPQSSGTEHGRGILMGPAAVVERGTCRRASRYTLDAVYKYSTPIGQRLLDEIRSLLKPAEKILPFNVIHRDEHLLAFSSRADIFNIWRLLHDALYQTSSSVSNVRNCKKPTGYLLSWAWRRTWLGLAYDAHWLGDVAESIERPNWRGYKLRQLTRMWVMPYCGVILRLVILPK